MNVQFNQRPDVQNEISLKKILIIAAGTSVVLGLIFFFAGNFLSSEKAKAEGNAKTYEISGNIDSKSNISIMRDVKDGDTLILVDDLYINKDCSELKGTSPVIKMAKGNLIFTKGMSLYLGQKAVILCRSGYHIMVEEIGITGCDNMTIGDGEKDDSDKEYDCEDKKCDIHNKRTKDEDSKDEKDSKDEEDKDENNSYDGSSCTFAVRSTNGYTVNVEIAPTTINVPTSCRNGYNFTVDLKYAISFTGSNAPSSIYTLQGYLVYEDGTENYFKLPTSGGSGTTSTSNSWRKEADCEKITVGALCKSIILVVQGPSLSYQKFYCTLGETSNEGYTDKDNESRIYFDGKPIISPYGTSAPISFCLASHSGWDNGNQTLLPVDLLSFDAALVNNKVELRWVTASEENNSHFEIQRSSDGLEFEVLGEVLGHGNSMVLRNYSYLDETAPLTDKHIYYRLKQIDFNGAFEYSPMIAFSASKLSKQSGKVYPNPADAQITVEHTSDNFNISIVNQSGSVVFSELNVRQRKTINTSVFPKGYYVVQIYNDRINESHKVLISH